MAGLNNREKRRDYFLLGLLIISQGMALFLNADLDIRYQTDFKDGKFLLRGLGLSLRQIFSDRMGDRLILFTFVDGDSNLKKIHLDQGYLLYKGPLGRWQIGAGRYRLPFGLLPIYSTKRLLLNGLSEAVIGTDVDNGVIFSGRIASFDYSISITQGAGMEWTKKIRPLLTARLGLQSVEFENFQVGLSGLLGRMIMEDTTHHLSLLGFDLSKYFGPGVLRSELLLGKKEERVIYGNFLIFDYALLPHTDLSLGLRYQNLPEGLEIIGGLTYNLPLSFFTLQLRIGQRFNLIRGGEDELTVQVYNYFARNF
jgi:hypothetical protein